MTRLPLACRDRDCARRRSRRRPARRPFDPARLSQHRQDTWLRRVRGPRPRDARRDQDDQLYRRPVQGGRAPARRRHRQRPAQLDPGRCRCCSRTSSATPHVTPQPRQRPADAADAGRGDRGAAPTERREGGRPRQRAAGVRRLRRHRARARTGTISRARTCSGKLLVVLINDPDFEGGEGDFGGKAMTYYGRWTYKYEEAARRGAAGRADRPRNRPRLLRLEHGQEFQHQHQFDIVRQNPAAEHTAVRKLDPARRSRRRFSPRRASTSTRPRRRRSSATSSRSRSRRR